MIPDSQKHAFEAQARKRPQSAALRADSAAARAGDRAAAERLCAALLHAAVVAPETARGIYATFRAGWLGAAETTPIAEAEPAPLSPAFWQTFWALFEGDTPADALAITGRVVALAAQADPSLLSRAEDAARAHPKAADAAHRAMPPRLTLGELARLPVGSLGHDFWRLIVDNKFDLEVLDREALSLAMLPPALRYLNIRILQMHDIWHLAGGFHTTALHEVAISAFQHAQFGHGYSAVFLAVAAYGAALGGGAEGAAVVLQTIAEASRYGEECPSFMAIPWESEWHRPLAAIRAQYSFAPFAGSYPADLVERLRPAA